MPFYSLSFLFFFLPAVLTGCWLSGQRLRSIFLLFASLLFYSWSSWNALPFLLVLISGNFFAGLLLDRLRNSWLRGLLFSLMIAANFFPLFYYRYFAFFLNGLSQLRPDWRLPLAPPDTSLTPLGISFITFHAVSYLADIFRRSAEAETNIVRLGLYFSFFPKIAAGPIQQYAEVAARSSGMAGFANFSAGTERFIIGLSKKLLLANVLSEIAGQGFDCPAAELTTAAAWLGAVCYTLQIYFDFSGYSDMAIGLGLMCGYRLPENFTYPYAAQSVREFWRRWHITLSRWFRDYLYIPLGGSRHGELRTCVNLLLVFLLCGLWHGANWTFLIWGLLHGLFLVFERLFLAGLLAKLPRAVRHSYLLIFVIISWVFFREDSLYEAWLHLRAMAGFPINPLDNPWILLKMDGQLFSVLIISTLLAFPFLKQGVQAACSFAPLAVFVEIARGIALAALFLLSLLELASGTQNAFIYFQF
ncbi:MBOAT family O-acyltransferase [Candidatus Electronema sp. JM]|uniref:MBOAT family O-acyltransferase n=1 Tax=Candidatus Electronema sp. JM TaxID=3401571 RepID=UPI003AA84BFB